MKISVEEHPKIEEIEIVIKCQTKNEQTTNILKTLTYLNKTITAKKGDRNFALTPDKIYYFDSIDNRVFAYTKVDVFDVSLKLYQLEDILENTPFIRVSKNCILNTQKIRSFSTSINGRMEATLMNKEKIIISRKYVRVLRQKLGGKNQ